MSFRFGAMIRLVDLWFQASIVDDVISVRGNDSTRGPTVSSLLRRWRFGATYRPETKKTKQFNSSINPLINFWDLAVMSFRFGATSRIVDLRFQASFVDGASEPRIDLKPKKQSNLIHQLTP